MLGNHHVAPEVLLTVEAKGHHIRLVGGGVGEGQDTLVANKRDVTQPDGVGAAGSFHQEPLATAHGKEEGQKEQIRQMAALGRRPRAAGELAEQGHA